MADALTLLVLLLDELIESAAIDGQDEEELRRMLAEFEDQARAEMGE